MSSISDDSRGKSGSPAGQPPPGTDGEQGVSARDGNESAPAVAAPTSPSNDPASVPPGTAGPHDAITAVNAPSPLVAATAPAPPESGDDRRGETRVPIELKVEYRRLNAFFSDYIKNISKGGTFIKTKRPLQIGTEFVFRLSIPLLEVPLELRGRVVWIQQEGDAPHHPGAPREPGMGIRFVFHEDSERTAVEQVVERLMSETLGQSLHDKLLRR